MATRRKSGGETIGEKLLRNSTINLATGCLEWSAALTKAGYGLLYDSSAKKLVYAHRASWMHISGPIPDGLFVCHKCDNRKCINREHLFLGTVLDNARDCVAKNRHAKGERSGVSVLTEQQVVEIRGSDEPERVICIKYGISRSLVGLIRRGERWAHVA